MEFTEVKDYIEANKDSEDVKGYLQGFNSLTVDGVQKYLSENPDGKSWFDSQRDQHLTKGLETFKSKTMPKLLEDEITKRFPAEDIKDKQIRELSMKFEQMEKDKARAELKNKATLIANEKKIPMELLDYFVGEDEDSTSLNLTKFQEVMNAHITSAIAEQLSNGYKPPATSAGASTNIPMDELAKMTPAEINKYIDEKVKKS